MLDDRGKAEAVLVEQRDGYQFSPANKVCYTPVDPLSLLAHV